MAKKVKFEIKTFDQSGTLVLNSPAEVTFVNVSQIIGNTVTINQAYTLGTVRDEISGAGTFPSSLVLRTNEGEIDETVYSIQGTNNEFILKAIIKYNEA